jgi:SAM-dependent methyltransferase
VDASGEGAAQERVQQTREFFGPRAAGWEDRFPDDRPRYERAVTDLAPRPGGAVLDAGCGTGRALPVLAAAIDRSGTVVGLDLTPEMLDVARRQHLTAGVSLVLGDVLRSPFAAGTFDAVFAAGLISHLPDAAAGLRELARICRVGAALALFHPVGRAALARRQGRELTPDDMRAEPNVRPLLEASGWACLNVDDAEDRYLVLATRR